MAIPDPATTEWVPIWNPVSQGPVGPAGPAGPQGPPGPAGTPGLHAPTHAAGGGDPVTVTTLAGYPGLPQQFLNGTGAFTVPPTNLHASRHSAGQPDVIDVTNLGGFPNNAVHLFLRDDATFQPVTPGAHHTTHEAGGADEVLFPSGVKERGRTVPMGEWQAFTPTWNSASSPQPSGASLIGRFTLIGKTCHFWINVSFGAGTTFGTDTWTFGYPLTASAAAAAGSVVGSAQVVNANLELRTGITVHADVNSCLIQSDHVGTYANPTVPFTWEIGDVLRFNGCYEIA